MSVSSRAVCVLLVLPLLAACGDEDVPPAPPAGQPARGGKARERVRFFERFRAAQRLMRAGDTRRAEEELRAALAIKPAHEAATLELVELRRAAGDRREAVALLDGLLHAKPGLARARMRLAALLSERDAAFRGDLQRAAALLDEACRENPQDTGPLLQRARVAALQGQVQRARECWTSVLGAHATSRDALLGLAELALADGAPERAAVFFSRALAAGMKATGRPDVPSEMDTQASFDVTGVLAPQNVAAFTGLARAARALGGWPPSVPAAQRLPDLQRLGPLDRACALPVLAGGVPAVADLDGDGTQEVVLPSGSPPVLVGWTGERCTVRPLEGLRPGASAGLCDLDGDGRGDLVLGGAWPDDPRPLRVLRDVGAHPSRAARTLAEASGLVLGPAPSAFGQGLLLARDAEAGARGLLLLTLTPGGQPRLSVLDERVPVAVARLGSGLALLTRDHALRSLQAQAAGPPRATRLLEDAGQATCLASADMDGDGHADLLIGRAAEPARVLQALVQEKAPPAQGIAWMSLDASGRPQGELQTLPGLPALAIRDLLPLPADGHGPPCLLVACGAEAFGAFSPSVLLDPSGPHSWRLRHLPAADAAREVALHACAPRGWGDRVLLVRGGSDPGTRLPPAVLVLPR